MANIDENKLVVRFKKFDQQSKEPSKPDAGSGAYDLYSISEGYINPHEIGIFDTGLGLEIPEGYAGIIYDRSSMGKNGYDKHGGFIDSSYRGRISVLLCNTSNIVKYIDKGQKIAQIAIQRVEEIEWIESQELSKSDRGEKGFGSSGK